MKLIDLLVRELKCWPDDVHCMTQDSDGDLNWHNDNSAPELNDDGVTWKCDESWMDYHKGWEISDDWKKAIVTRDQYQSALAASQKVEWSGDGLPPVGAKVEFFINPKLGYRNDWIPDVGTEMEVVAHRTTTDDNDVAVCYWDDGGAGRSCCFVPESIKPLRSEADKKRDEAINSLTEFTPRGDACDIYNAIAAGKIPGVKLGD